jgi:hypothetical protein
MSGQRKLNRQSRQMRQTQKRDFLGVCPDGIEANPTNSDFGGSGGFGGSLFWSCDCLTTK